MKNEPMMNQQPNQTRNLNWLYQEDQEDDFLLGKTPSEFQDSWEDEE